MSFEVRLRQEAERDIDDAAGWYKHQREGLGQQFLDEVLRALRSLAERPTMYPIVHRDTRRALIRRFPFGVYYRIHGETVSVLAVMHGSRDPRRWKGRT